MNIHVNQWWCTLLYTSKLQISFAGQSMEIDCLFDSFPPDRHKDDTKRKCSQIINFELFSTLWWKMRTPNSLPFQIIVAFGQKFTWLTLWSSLAMFTTGNSSKGESLQLVTVQKEKVFCGCDGLKRRTAATGHEKERLWQVLPILKDIVIITVMSKRCICLQMVWSAWHAISLCLKGSLL